MAEGWAVLNSDGDVVMCSVAWYRRDAIKQYMGLWEDTSDRHWRKLKRRGFRCARVTVTPSPQNTEGV